LSGWQEAVKLEFIAKQACVILSWAHSMKLITSHNVHS
jgi:hypothetical protein